MTKPKLIIAQSVCPQNPRCQISVEGPRAQRFGGPERTTRRGAVVRGHSVAAGQAEQGAGRRTVGPGPAAPGASLAAPEHAQVAAGGGTPGGSTRTRARGEEGGAGAVERRDRSQHEADAAREPPDLQATAQVALHPVRPR